MVILWNLHWEYVCNLCFIELIGMLDCGINLTRLALLCTSQIGLAFEDKLCNQAIESIF